MSVHVAAPLESVQRSPICSPLSSPTPSSDLSLGILSDDAEVMAPPNLHSQRSALTFSNVVALDRAREVSLETLNGMRCLLYLSEHTR
jgi:hypothetical protein